ncbi:MAG: alpha/beta fold hydrolase, partial [Gammaproteobacteria bacterium]
AAPCPGLRGVAALAPHVLTEAKGVAEVRRAIAAYESGRLAEGLSRYHGDNTECAFRGWSGVWTDPGFLRWNVEAELEKIAVPVLAVRGAGDPYNTGVHLERIAARVTAPLVCRTLDDCAHAPHAEQPDTVLALLAQWLDEAVMRGP